MKIEYRNDGTISVDCPDNFVVSITRDSMGVVVFLKENNSDIAKGPESLKEFQEMNEPKNYWVCVDGGRCNDKLGAIKALRNAKNVSLGDAKAGIETLMQSNSGLITGLTYHTAKTLSQVFLDLGWSSTYDNKHSRKVSG